MKHGSTLFLKSIIALIGLVAAGFCLILLGVSISGNGGTYLPILLGMLMTAVPFFYALYQGFLLLRYIDANTAFSEKSVSAVWSIKYCAGSISLLYALMMPFIIYVSEKDNAPGATVLGLVLIFAPLVMSVFAAVLEKLLKNAIDIKSENDLTV